MKTWIAVTFLALGWGVAAVTAPAQLSGRYTIDPGGSGPRNFRDLISAVGALGAGVTAPVTFDVKPVTYRGALIVSSVPGASSLNVIRFIARGSVPATIDALGASVGFLGATARWFTFENFRVQNASGAALELRRLSYNQTSFNTFVRCEFDAPAVAVAQVYAAHLLIAEDNTFQQCRFAGGMYALFLDGAKRNVFDRCRVDGKGTARVVVYDKNGNDGDNLWKNCVVENCGPTGNGLRFPSFGGGGEMVWHNTIVVTSAKPAVMVFGSGSWNRAGSFRNNVVVNLGSGPAVEYAESSAGLVPYDYDHNCYWAPNAGGVTVKTNLGLYAGSLAGWKAFLKAKPQLIPPGGGQSWDPRSVEMDPGLVRIASPVDAHLKPGSPLLDLGTRTLIEGKWVTYDWSAQVHLDLDGAPREKLVDIGADELTARLGASGTPRPGGVIVFTLRSAHPGRPYQCGSSQGGGPIPLGRRSIPLSPDPLLVLTVSGVAPQVVSGYSGVLDAQGNGSATLRIPNLPALQGVRVHTAFIVLDPVAPQGVADISNGVVISITR